MVYILEDTAFKYLLDELPKSIFPELWEKFEQLCLDNVIISDRETKKILLTELVNAASLEWLEKNKSVFSSINEKEASVLGVMMKDGLFSRYASDSRIIDRRLPEGVPFIIAMAKVYEAESVVVYRKKSRNDPIVRSLCDKEHIRCLEVEDMLLQLKANLD